jgi:hypothetical protein
MFCNDSANFKLIRHAEEQRTSIAAQKFRVGEQTVRSWVEEKEILSQDKRFVGQAWESQCH